MQRQIQIMHWSRITIVLIVLCAALLVAGCTQNSANPTTVNPSGTSESLEKLALTPAEVPANFTLAESHAKNQSEVSSAAMGLGWQAGYLVLYTSSLTGSSVSSEIRQTITQYPETNIEKILASAAFTDQAAGGMEFSYLPSPGLGNASQAFQGTVMNTTVDSKGIVQIPTQGQPISSHGPEGQKFVEILFTKGNIFEVLRMSGPDADYSVLKGIAGTAYDKIS
jgi:hypothetical protein